MALITPVAGTRKMNSEGRFKESVFDLATIADGDTCKVPGLRRIVSGQVIKSLSTDTACVASSTGQTVTFSGVAASTARVRVRGY